MDHKIILKCRVCLDEFDEEKMFDLFTTDTPEKTLNFDGSNDANKKGITGGKRLKLGEKLEFCCGVRIRESSEMPTKICIKCFDITRIWFNFRQMCVNSQVYLESMCKDHCNSSNQPDCDEDKYLEYLLEDLQTFRMEARHANVGFSVNTETDDYNDQNDHDSANSDRELSQTDSDNEYLEALPLDAAYLDPDLEHIIENIKREHPEEQLDAREKRKPREKGATGMQRQQRRNVEKKYNSYNGKKRLHNGKKRLRSASPASYMCSICGNVYTKKASFTYHMSLHSNVKPHECELCGKSFRQVCELKNHMRRHTGEKPYKCSYCDRHFIDRSEKHRHERVHTNTRPYVCSVCGKSFMYSAILKNHLKLHSGEKEYNCLVCQKAFTLQHQLKAHLQTITHKQKESQFVNAGYDVVYE